MNENIGANDPHQLLGAYLLGGLQNSERQIFETHLASCARCREELDAASSIPSILNILEPLEVRQVLISEPARELTVPTHLPSHESDESISLLSRLASARHRKRTTMGIAAALGLAASVVLGIFIAPLFAHEPKPDVSYSAVSDIGTQIQVGMNAKAWGTEVQFKGTKLPTDGLLSLWVIDGQGAAEKAGAWRATTTGSTKLIGATPMQLKEIRILELRAPDSKVLVKLDAHSSQD